MRKNIYLKIALLTIFASLLFNVKMVEAQVTPCPWSTPVETSLPGSGDVQSQSDFIFGMNTKLMQAFWRGGQNFWRVVPVVNGEPQWSCGTGGTCPWSTPVETPLPGSGDVQSQSEFAFPGTRIGQSLLMQSFWRGGQNFWRIVPIDINDEPQWSCGTNGTCPWSTPVETPLPGSGDVQSQSEFKFGLGTKLMQAFWRGGWGYWRIIPITPDGKPQWSSAGRWSDPVSITTLPGTGDIQSQSEFIFGSGANKLMQAFWRGGQNFWRVVPLVNDEPQWSCGVVPTLTLPPNCPLKREGDANCDNVVDELDFGIWKTEFTTSGNGEKTADFDPDSRVDLRDYEIWRKTTTAPPRSTVPPRPTSITPTAAPTATLIPTAAPTPTFSPRRPNPPIINISYPLEMQLIRMTQSQTLCVVDVPAGGNTQGLQRKHQFNDGGWASYTNLFTLCLEPKEGLNRLQMQYKNGNGDESTIYTRQFNFHRIVEISISLNGQLYRDVNCNGIRDSGENGIGATATLNIYKIPEFYIYSTINSDSNGSFSFSGKINENETLTLRPIPVSPSGYKRNPYYTEPSITFSSSNKSVTVDIPQVPNENVGACSAREQ